MSRTPDDACQIDVRVTPRSSKNKIARTPEGVIQVWTTAPPTDGQANAAVCEAVAKALGIAKSSVAVVRGDASRHKTLRIDGLSAQEVQAKLAD